MPSTLSSSSLPSLSPQNAVTSFLHHEGNVLAAKRILIVDDEKEVCCALAGILEDEGAHVSWVQSLEEAWKIMATCNPHLILLDVWLNKGAWDGLEALDQLSRAHPSLPVVMMSGHSTLTMAVRALKKGAQDFLEKPLDSARLLTTVKNVLALNQWRPAAPSASTQDTWKHHWPFPLSETLQKLARSPQPVMIMGATGAPALFMATAMAHLSQRSSHKIRIVGAQELNSMDPALLHGQEESGQVKQLGFLENIQGGTCILQNIHHLNQDWQRYLCGVLETKHHRRLGGAQCIPIDVRFIATTISPTASIAPHGFFYEAFYQRMAINPIAIEPLTKQPEQIRHWASFLLNHMTKTQGIAPVTLQEDALRALEGYQWTGHVAQLSAALAWGLQGAMSSFSKMHQEGALSSNTPWTVSIGLNHLPYDISKGLMAVRGAVESLDFLLSLPLKEARALFEWHYMRAQLASIQGNMAQTAKTIGMNRAALHRKMKMLHSQIQQYL